MAEMPVPREIPVRFLGRPQKRTVAALGAMVAVGLAAFAVALATDPDRAWRAYLTSWLWATSIAQGAVILAVATQITRAQWAWSVRRVASAFSAFLPVSFILLIPLLLKGAGFFPWVAEMAHDPILQKKAAYLNLPFLVARNVVGLGLLYGLSLYFVYLALRPDLGLAQANGGPRHPLHSRLTRGWRGQETEEVRSHRLLARLGPATALIYAAVFSVIAWDWVMSLEPHWYSTLLGAWFFMGAFWGGVAATAIASLLLRRCEDLRPLFGQQQLHDLGKLAFAFCVFWAYLFWSQYLVIWYGKLPWEQSFVIQRSQPPWSTLGATVVVLCFVVPFAGLLGRRPKTMPGTLGLFAGVILLGLWCERLLMVAPPLYHGEGPAVSFVEPLVALAFVALLTASVLWFLATFPVIQVWQPMVEAEAVETAGEAAHS
ncbi:MAG: hypothetical protein HY704_09930 [Gemmatimonadetes bacterium]|nr:hypothetical protein [Gemmatimonadota bacterium]